ncbi:MAG: serine hydrolase domain-containing protein, partial [Pseudomonadota bacterium]
MTLKNLSARDLLGIPSLFPFVFGFGVALTASSAACADIVIDQDIVEPKYDTHFQRMQEEERFSGVALVVIDGEVRHAKGYGLARDGTPNAVTTAFHVASITKQFTAAAVMQLVEREQISLTASINSYLPEVYRSARWNAVTVHHLLSHTSGVPDYAVERDYYNVVDGFCLGNTVDGMIKEAMSRDLDFDPGSEFRYSNIGYTLLGLE